MKKKSVIIAVTAWLLISVQSSPLQAGFWDYIAGIKSCMLKAYQVIKEDLMMPWGSPAENNEVNVSWSNRAAALLEKGDSTVGSTTPIVHYLQLMLPSGSSLNRTERESQLTHPRANKKYDT